MKKTLGALLSTLVLLTLVSCGQNSEPLAALGDPNATYEGKMTLPIVPITGFIAFNGTNPVNDGFDLNSNISIVRSPISGIITAQDGLSATIRHNSHVTTRVSRLISVSRNVGDFVDNTTQIGTSVLGAPGIHFSVYVDGVAVCPYAFLVHDPADQQAVLTASGGVPCTY